MRCKPNILLLAVALVASGSCLAQQARPGIASDFDSTSDARIVQAKMPAPGLATASLAADPTSPAAADTTQPTRSAFGKVMAIMISSLQREPGDSVRPAAPVHTTAAGTPLDIEIGDAFRTSQPPSASQPDYAVRQPALAGPD